MRAANPKATRVYVLPEEQDLPEKVQTRWKFSNLSTEERCAIANVQDQTGTMVAWAIHLGLAGAENFLDENGNEVEFKRDNEKRFLVGKKRPWSSDTLDQIDFKTLEALAIEILKGEELSRAEAKNS